MKLKITIYDTMVKQSFSAIFTLILIFVFNYPSFSGEGTVLTITYHSSTQNVDCKMNVYLPYGYNEPADTVNSYPVFYLLHGGGENYTHWVNSGELKPTMDSYIETGKAVPMIVVMPDGKNLAPDIFSQELIKDIIPYIESNYRAIADKDHRGVGGLSWGGLQALEPGLYHYEMFGYLAILSSGWFSTETATYEKARTFLADHGKEMEKNYRYFYFAEGTSEDIAYSNGQATLSLLRENGLTIHYWEFPSGHWWGVWRQDLKTFAPYLFRDSSIVYVSLNFMGGNIKNSTVMTQADCLVNAPSKPTRTGYSFSGWFRDPEYTIPFDFQIDTIRKNLTVYANWDINSYKVAFNTNGATETPDTLLLEYNSLIQEPKEPNYEGYIFDGWYTNQSFGKKWNFATDRVSDTLTLYAKWTGTASLLDENKYYPINLYPNPTTSGLHFEHLPVNALIEIFDIEGKLMLQKVPDSSAEYVHMDGFGIGSYIVRVSNNKFIWNNKIAIKID